MCITIGSLHSGEDEDSQEDFRDLWITSVQLDRTGLFTQVLPVVPTFKHGISGSVCDRKPGLEAYCFQGKRSLQRAALKP